MFNCPVITTFYSPITLLSYNPVPSSINIDNTLQFLQSYKHNHNVICFPLYLNKHNSNLHFFFLGIHCRNTVKIVLIQRSVRFDFVNWVLSGVLSHLQMSVNFKEVWGKKCSSKKNHKEGQFSTMRNSSIKRISVKSKKHRTA